MGGVAAFAASPRVPSWRRTQFSPPAGLAAGEAKRGPRRWQTGLCIQRLEKRHGAGKPRRRSIGAADGIGANMDILQHDRIRIRAFGVGRWYRSYGLHRVSAGNPGPLASPSRMSLVVLVIFSRIEIVHGLT